MRPHARTGGRGGVRVRGEHKLPKCDRVRERGAEAACKNAAVVNAAGAITGQSDDSRRAVVEHSPCWSSTEQQTGMLKFGYRAERAHRAGDAKAIFAERHFFLLELFTEVCCCQATLGPSEKRKS